MTVLHIDFETRGVLDLREVGLHRYARDPDTDVWCMAWALDGNEPYVWTPDAEVQWPKYADISKCIFYAHNAPFELEIWNQILVPRYGWPELKPEQTFCTMAQCYAMGLPGNLEDAAYAAGVNYLKDTEGRALMLRMARPRSKPGVRPIVWWDELEKRQRLYEYCRQDVRVERALHERLMPLSSKERKLWLVDYKINQRGVQLDTTSVNAAIKMADAVKAECDKEMAKLTGDAVQSVTAVVALKTWLAGQGVETDSVAKQAIVDLLNQGNDDDVPDTLPPAVRKVLLLRQEAGKASTAKFDVMAARAGEDGRLRQMYQYHGTQTGRWAGRGVQVHNLPRDMPSAEAVEHILALVRAGDWRAIDMIYGAPLTVLSRCLRSFFVAPPGKKLVSGDWSNVEGRGQAWFAGEDWKIKAFVAADNKQGPGIYELAYARMFGVPVESVKNPSEERQIGKVSELAFGYQGGVGSFRTMAKSYPEVSGKISDQQADEFKLAWRAAHPRIKQTWFDIEQAAVSAVRAPDGKFSCGHPARQATYRMVGSFLWCLLPSGRVICYPYPKLLEDGYGPKLTYMCVPSAEDRKKGKIIHDPSNSATWARIATYGGALFNNIVQGFCRDFLADGILALDEKGASIVLHTHDDLNIEVAAERADGARRAMEDIMRTPPAWAAGFPLVAKCAVMDRYGK